MATLCDRVKWLALASVRYARRTHPHISPRMTPCSFQKPYSERISSPGTTDSSGEIAIFMLLAFCLSGSTIADDSNLAATVGVRNHDVRECCSRHGRRAPEVYPIVTSTCVTNTSSAGRSSISPGEAHSKNNSRASRRLSHED